MMKECADLPMFGLKNLKVLKQIAGTIVGKNGRPDHKKRAHNDALMSYAIGLYVYKVAGEQISNHVNEFERQENLDPWASRVYVKSETRKVLGSKKGLDERQLNRR
jgi:hypothetical protein